MYHSPRSIPPTTITLSKRTFESDTWLILGVAAAIFAVLSSLGIFILCYRRRGHKRRMDKQRMTAGKSRGKYVPLDEEKRDTEGQEQVPLTERVPVNSPRITPPPPTERVSRVRSQSQTQSILFTPSPPAEVDRRRELSPQPPPQPHLPPPVEPQVGFASVNLQHPQPQGVHLPPPVVAKERERPFHDHDDDYDGRTGQRFERSRSPSPGRLVLSRSISMLRPRE